MALDTPTFISPVPGLDDSIQEFTYRVTTQGLDSRPLVPDTELGLDLLEYPKFSDPRVTLPAVIGTIPYNTRIVVTKKIELAGEAPWYFGTGDDADDVERAGWFQKE